MTMLQERKKEKTNNGIPVLSVLHALLELYWRCPICPCGYNLTGNSFWQREKNECHVTLFTS
jgi:hypothetical protein